MDGPPADEDSRVHSDPEESDEEVMQEQAQTAGEDETEDEDGDDLLENMEGYISSPGVRGLASVVPREFSKALTALYTTRWLGNCSG